MLILNSGIETSKEAGLTNVSTALTKGAAACILSKICLVMSLSKLKTDYNL